MSRRNSVCVDLYKATSLSHITSVLTHLEKMEGIKVIPSRFVANLVYRAVTFSYFIAHLAECRSSDYEWLSINITERN